MTLTELRYIVAVARERHFGHAAEACFVSQPTLSVAIRKLEDELGVEIFERLPGEVNLTAIGEQIVEQAQRTLDEAELIKALAQQSGDPLATPINIGAIYTIGPYLFPQLIPALHKLAPQMSLLIEENYTSNLSEKLKHGKLDVIIIALPFNEPNILTLELYEEPFVVAIPRAHPWAELKQIPGNSLSKENLFLLGAGNCFRDQVLKAFPKLKQPQDKMQKALEGSSLETIRHMVASGAGVTVLPERASRSDEGGLITYKPFKPPVPTRHIALAWRKSFTRPQVIDILKSALNFCDTTKR